MIEDILKKVFASIPKRTQEVLTRRFGLKNNERQTLEEIGSRWGITRERVRQIEAAGFRALRKKGNLGGELKTFAVLARGHLEQHGGVREEGRFLDELKFVANDRHPASPSRIKFLLALDGSLYFAEENDKTYPYWATSERSAKLASFFLEQCLKEMNKIGSPLPLTEAEAFVRRVAVSKSLEGLASGALLAFLPISKLVSYTPFGEFGPADWPTIVPRGVRDRAYQVLRAKKQPLHFRVLARYVNEHAKLARDFHPVWQKTIGTQTVHNELIKDMRFVLVGRGVYALTEWGYRPGTVKEVLAMTLQKAGKPMARDELMRAMKKERFVQDNTIAINLQDRKLFDRLPDGKYRLRRGASRLVQEA